MAGAIQQVHFGISRAFKTLETSALNADSTDGTAYGFRIVFAVAGFSLSQPGNKIRLTLTPPVAGSNPGVSSVWVGHAGTTPNFDGNQVQVFFGGAASPSLVAGGSPVVSDDTVFSFDATKPLIVSFAVTALWARFIAVGSVSNIDLWYKISDQANVATTSVAGYTQAVTTTYHVSKIEIF